ncbi:FAD-dependent oxidoreductase [Noviherbaspirillum galbum]|uniref:FAD-dependent oxidoreductase n=1 Tax=Noviherbaspirillum galbum TaxID=2709383 RepID=A0A6B3SFW1_9BURK|nr:FAD-dependent oxidoreductase [Noviherbaspirillum galbum]NEX59721.1 FAD-dependent oxidoreductase [Noviherbaspirillum galbum]
MTNLTNGASMPLWLDTASVPRFPPLTTDKQTDVCVIGAGIAGMTAAYLLAREGRQVLLIDAMGIGAGETGRTTAHFFPPDEWYAGVEEGFGEKGARQVAASFAGAIDLVEAIIRTENIDCGFERLDGYLYALPGDGFKDFDKEVAAAVRAGVDAEKLDKVPGLSFGTGSCVRYRNQAQFHPVKYLAGLAHAIVRLGGEIHGGTQALDVSGDPIMQTVRTQWSSIRAQAVVVATNTPFNNRMVMHTKQAAYRTYAVALRVPRGAVPRILLWDTGDPYYYVRLETPDAAAQHEYLIVGGADHKVGEDDHPEHRYDEIERWVRQRFPMAQQVEYRWSGEVMEPADGPAYLGRNPMDDDNVYIITGDSGNGMTHATIGAMVITDMLMGRDNPWAALYDPSRKVKHGLTDFMKEQADTLVRYADWARHGEAEFVEEIPPGEGRIMQMGSGKLAVYRDEQGGLHALDATCTHLGCVVHWNGGEKSWDCPCHGSRFGTDGQVLHGPAATPLLAVAVEQPGMPAPDAGRDQPPRPDAH